MSVVSENPSMKRQLCACPPENSSNSGSGQAASTISEGASSPTEGGTSSRPNAETGTIDATSIPDKRSATTFLLDMGLTINMHLQASTRAAPISNLINCRRYTRLLFANSKSYRIVTFQAAEKQGPLLTNCESNPSGRANRHSSVQKEKDSCVIIAK